jgi:SPP1 family predicted phage head-tail adaptor
MFNQVIELVTKTITFDEIGQELETVNYVQVMAEKNPIQRAEFFNGGTIGIKPAAMFKIRECDYTEQKEIRFNSDIYTIYRVFSVKNEMIELYCEKRLG